MILNNFRDKVILITGAASGFGRLLVEKLLPAGAKLVIGDLDEAGLTSVASLPGGDTIIARYCDVTREAEVESLVATAVEFYGRLDIAINNAGIATPLKSFVETTEAELDHNFAVNAKGVFFGMKYEIAAMLKQNEGVILNVASVAGLNGAPKLAAYAASKHAVVGLTRTAAVEYARKNIRVNAICPFYSPTPLLVDSDINERRDFLANGSPMKRLGSPDEMVSAMLLIIDPANSYMTGQAIAVDGGVLAI